MRLQLAHDLQADWVWAYQHHATPGAYKPDAVSSGRRALRGLALNYLCQTQGAWPAEAMHVFENAHNMTERMHGLQALLACQHPLAEKALALLHAWFKNDELVLDKWFAVQASASDQNGHVLNKVRQLMLHPDFQIRNPNRALRLVSTYCANPAAFHRRDAAGYVFWSERVLELDAINPQVAARLARALDRWRKLAEPYRSAAREAISRVASKADLSPDVREVVSRALAE